MKSASFGREIIGVTVLGLIALAVICLILPAFLHQRKHYHGKIRMEITQLMAALEDCRTGLGKGQYPPSSTEDAEAVKQFLVTAFPHYHGGLPEKYKNLDAASSLVFWLGGMTDSDGNMIGFSADREKPFDTTNKARIGPFFAFDLTRLRDEGGLPIYLPVINSPPSDPYVYFRPDSNGEYHGAWKKCRPCRDSTTGGWINPKSYQLFSPGKDGKYGSGVQYPNGTDYDAQRMDDMSNFTNGATLGDDMP